MSAPRSCVAIGRARPTRRGTGAARARLGVLLLFASCWAADTVTATAADSNPSAVLDQLMGVLAQQHHREADFQESQYLAILTRPLISAGVLIYDAPDHLEQRTVRPRRQDVVLDHGVLSMQIGKRRRTVQLTDYPQLAPLIDSIRATLAGDRAALERVFELQFSGTLEHWQLRLVPRTGQLTTTLQAIQMQGEGAAIREVQMRQSDGDRSVMHIQPHE